MNVGGYVLVDCKGMNLLAQSEQTIPGLYEKVKKAIATGKPIIATNCVYGEGVPLTPIQVFTIEEAGVFICTASILQIRVAPGDKVTVVSLVTG